MAGLSYGRIVVVEIDVPRAQSISPHKVLIAWRPLVLGVSCQHALNAHAYTLDVLDWAPSLASQQIKANYAVRVYVWVYRDWTVISFDKSDLRSFYKYRKGMISQFI